MSYWRTKDLFYANKKFDFFLFEKSVLHKGVYYMRILAQFQHRARAVFTHEKSSKVNSTIYIYQIKIGKR